MGWTHCYSITTKAAMRDDLLRQLTYDREGRWSKVLAHRTVGNHLWLAVESGHIVNGQAWREDRFVVLCLLGKSQGAWGYKDMDETAHPYFYDCPLSIIEAAGPTDNESALTWRAKVHEYHAERKRRREMLKSIKVGSVVRLENSKPDRFRVTSVKPLRGYAAGTGAGPYRLPKTRIVEVNADPSGYAAEKLPGVTVHDLRNYSELTFTCSPREAVIAAYAQSRGDWNTWDYEEKYGELVRYSGTGNRTVSCGDFAAVAEKGAE